MQRTTKWTAVLMCVAVALGSVQWSQAQTTKGETRFERVLESFGVPQIKPTQGKRVTQMAKRRRIIINDDGEVAVGKEVLEGMQYADTIEEWLAVRFKNCVGTQVDSYFFNVAATDRGPVREGEVITNPQSSMAQFFYWGERGKIHPATEEATRALIDRAHEAGMEIFVSVRMNDTHDAGVSQLNYPLKVQRPDLLIGEQQLHTQESDSVMSAYWSALDYAKEEVRQHFLEFILTYCRQYDYDGVELDYFRMPICFKFGEEQENLDTMTEFVRQVRQGLDEIGRERGRPYLLTARVLDTPELSLRTGLDVEQWLKEGLMDLLIVGGGYMVYGGRQKRFIDLAHRYGVPAYPCINHFDSPIEMNSRASNFWALGADGVYVFNYYGVAEGSEQQQSLHQMGDPDILLGLDKQYLPDNGFTFIYYGHASQPPQFPVRLVDGTPIELVVGDDLQKAALQGMIEEMRLQIQVSNMDENEGIRIFINGGWVSPAAIERVAEDSFAAVIQAPPLRRGINQIVVLPGLHCIGRLSSAVTGLELSVRYKQD